MDDGISINVATGALTALGGGGLGAAIMYWVKGLGRRRARDCEDCPAHHELERRVNELEKNDAAQTALLKSIDRRLETLNNFMMNNRR